MIRRAGFAIGGLLVLSAVAVVAAGWYIERTVRQDIDRSLAQLPGGAVATYSALDVDILGRRGTFRDFIVLRDGRHVLEAAELSITDPGPVLQGATGPGTQAIAGRIEVERLSLSPIPGERVAIATLTLEKPAADADQLRQLALADVDPPLAAWLGALSVERAVASGIAQLAAAPATAAVVTVDGLGAGRIQRLGATTWAVGPWLGAALDAEDVTLGGVDQLLRGAAGAAVPVAGRLLVRDVRFATEADQRLSFGELSLEAFGLTERASPRGADRLIEWLTSVSIGAARLSSLRAEEPSERRVSTAQSATVRGWIGSKIDAVEARTLSVTSPVFEARVGRLALTGFTGVARDAGPLPTGSFALSDLLVEAPDVGRVSLARATFDAKSASPPSAWYADQRIEIGPLVYHPSSTAQAAVPYGVLAGRERVTATTALTMTAADDNRRLAVTIELQIADAGEATLALDLVDSAAWLALAPPAASAVTGWGPVRVEHARLTYRDQGLVALGFAAAGRATGLPAAQLQMLMPLALEQTVRRSGRGPASQAAASVLARFLQTPATVTAVFAPSRPMRLDTTIRLLQEAPDAAADTFGITLTTDP